MKIVKNFVYSNIMFTIFTVNMRTKDKNVNTFVFLAILCAFDTRETRRNGFLLTQEQNFSGLVCKI